MSWIVIKLDVGAEEIGPATVIETHVDEDIEHLRGRILASYGAGHRAWFDDCVHELTPGDRVELGTLAIRKLGEPRWGLLGQGTPVEVPRDSASVPSTPKAGEVDER